MSQAKPFVKWIGGKRNSLAHIKQYFPKTFNNYYEPFVGGGAVFFDLCKENSFISDINSELITTYLVIKNNTDSLIKALKEHKVNHNEEYFYAIRNKEEICIVAIAARFIYLNKTCYNGMYRVNKNNRFNVPFNKKANPNIFCEDNLNLCKQSLLNADIKCQSYEKITPGPGDFVYFDPPYHGGFLSYDKAGFNEEKQIELRQFCDKLTSDGVKIVLSNSDTDFIKQQYKSYDIKTIAFSKFVNCKGSDRKGHRQLVITNF